MTQDTQPKETKISYISNPFKVIFKGFDALFKYNQTLSIIILVASLIGFIGNVPFQSGYNPSTNTSNVSDGTSAIFNIIVLFILILILPLIIFITTIYQGIVAYTVVATINGKTVTFAEAFKAAMQKFWVILGTSIIVFFKILGGIILFIIPGIRAALRYQFAYLPIFDENANISTTINRSKSLTKNHLIEVFGMITASSIIPIVGGIMSVGGLVVMYPQLKELKASNAAKPPVHWLNYLGLILVSGLLLFIIFFTVFIILVISRL